MKKPLNVLIGSSPGGSIALARTTAIGGLR
jgi:hypothetical protein